jgi:hypothetical protein
MTEDKMTSPVSAAPHGMSAPPPERHSSTQGTDGQRPLGRAQYDRPTNDRPPTEQVSGYVKWRPIVERLSLGENSRVVYDDGVIGSNVYDLLSYVYLGLGDRPFDVFRFKELLAKVEIESKPKKIVRWLPLS